MAPDALTLGARGGGITVAGQAAQLVIQFTSAVVLSRVLAPADFGLVAMVAVFMSVGELLRDFGIPTAALQAPVLTRAQASNLFWASSAMGGTTGLLLALATPAVVALYDEPRLAHIVPVMSCVLLANGLQAQIQVQLARSMRFVALSATSVGSQLVALAIAVGAARAGWGYWALVAQVVSASALLLASRFAVAGWLPARPARGHGSRSLLRTGGEFGVAQVLTFAAGNADTVMIGTVWDASALGFYNRAFQLLTVPVQSLLSPLTHVVVPTLNAAAGTGRRSSDLLLRAQFVLGVPVVWAFLVTAATADQAIPIVLGDQWGPSIPLFQVLAIGGSVWVLSFISYWAFVVEQQSRQLVLYNLVTKTVTIALVVAAAFVSVRAVAWAYSLALVVSWPVNLVWLRRHTGHDSWRFLVSGLRILASGALGYGCVRVVLGLVDLTAWPELLLGVVVFSLAFAAGIAATRAGRQEVADTLRLSFFVLRRSTTRPERQS